MPDRYGEPDEDDEDETSVVDFDSRRRAREAAAAVKAAASRRKALVESRAVHSPLNSEQAEQMRRHQQMVAEQAEKRRRIENISRCSLCDDDGYRLEGIGGIVCDHIDHAAIAARGLEKIREAMGWDEPTNHPDTSDSAAQAPRTAPNQSFPTQPSNE
ncbi:hypothetical protein SEA_GODPHATHER_58 [Mycobacterium phage GodPhather]|uniref:Uncharacterized protein n=2 Tax=Northamptonvirus TaxID=3044777 RepID=A0A1J0ME84_9CAUD|nr:hypothetical protein PQB70_gp57 [Mycobacterium phage Jeon]YP_010665426.1 hypothetical protein PQB71_gp57 [Mycobacterium phage Taptic]APD19287.1 hypothetical protein SEA_TAPTIC_57 [Mycobacterium phage Taptic]AVO21760.1 hypothetical protein SEA_JEON_57 [Mycobacterium phage Jeon]QBP32631.1 hypothetical protein SEA_GODPHATHER_58 [Mycobacterium phage GodPhather]